MTTRGNEGRQALRLEQIRAAHPSVIILAKAAVPTAWAYGSDVEAELDDAPVPTSAHCDSTDLGLKGVEHALGEVETIVAHVLVCGNCPLSCNCSGSVSGLISDICATVIPAIRRDSD